MNKANTQSKRLQLLGSSQRSLIAGCLLAACALLVNTAAAGGGGFLCRADFLDDELTKDATYRVISDGGNQCTSGAALSLEEAWDYWSSRDPDIDPECGGGGGGQNDVSNGGRWIMFTWNQDWQRWITVNWKGADCAPGPDQDPDIPDPCAPNLDDILYPGYSFVDSDPEIDNLLVRFSPQRLFKAGVTKHELTIEIREGGGGRSWSLKYKEPLFVTQDNPADPTHVLWTTTDSSGDPTAAARADLLHHVKPGKGGTKIIGTYTLPLAICVFKTTHQ